MKRRDFLKLAGLSTALAAAGCGDRSNQTLIPFLNPPEDIVPGIPAWFASTCRQCPAGCGIWAKNREGRVIKLEGNPEHPINRGRLCARGQAGLQDLYSPDRLLGPSLRKGVEEAEVAWKQARELLHAKAGEAGGRVAVLSCLESGYDAQLWRAWLARYHSERLEFFEPIDYEALRAANRLTFGRDVIPHLDISSCDCLISVGADFLETWLSPVEFAAQFTTARTNETSRAAFFYAGARLSLTAAAADHWFKLPAGREADFAFALLAALLEANPPDADAADLAQARAALGEHTIENLAAKTGNDVAVFHQLAAKILAARLPFVFADGSANAAVAANLINALTGGLAAADYSRPLAYSQLSSRTELEALRRDLAGGAVQVLVIHRANPVYAWPGFAEALAKVPFVVAVDTVRTETTDQAHLVLPVHSRYETWGSYEPVAGLISLLQPAMGPLVKSAAHLDEILALPKEAPAPADQPRTFAVKIGPALGVRGDPQAGEYRARLARGFGEAAPPQSATPPGLSLSSYVYESPPHTQGLTLLAYPSLRWFDGRDANKTWMQEIPDPLTCLTWDGWVEVHPQTAKQFGVRQGDIVTVKTRHGEGEAAVYVHDGLEPATIAVPLGMGHAAGRYAQGLGFNPLPLTRGAAAIPEATLTATGRTHRLANTDGSRTQHGRNVARAVREGAADEHEPEHTKGRYVHLAYPVRIPIETRHDPKVDMYPPVKHNQYRWGMIVDLDKCTGCSACVTACFAENNVAVVGKKQVLKGREMQWLTVQRYFEDGENPGVRFLLMLCQHCNNGPCEAVCPVTAPHHNSEGLNTQIYNRCVGTRYCSQNCPYKVRRFNWHKYTREKPLDMQLNPDVTVRGMGVMEKCSFCVQRIKEAHQVAKTEKRTIRDGEVVPACAQTCPTGALVFGNLMDGESRVYQLAHDARAYQVLDELNTQPGVIYLKRLVRDAKLEKA